MGEISGKPMFSGGRREHLGVKKRIPIFRLIIKKTVEYEIRQGDVWEETVGG